MAIPPFNDRGDLPAGIHAASLDEIVARFGQSTTQRQLVGLRLCRIYELALATGCLARAIVFGSFVSQKPDPNDVDVFLVMDDAFEVAALPSNQRLVFENASAQSHFGASVFWVRRMAAYPSEEEAVSGWGIKRDGTVRGIVELSKEKT